MKVEKYKGAYFKGSVYPRKSGRSFRVVYPLGWNNNKKKYDEYCEEAPSFEAARDILKDIDDFIYHGGQVSDIPLHRGKAKPEPPAKQVTVKEYIDEYCKLRADQKAIGGWRLRKQSPPA